MGKEIPVTGKGGTEVQAALGELIDATWGFSALLAAAECGLPEASGDGATADDTAARCNLDAGLATALLDVLVSTGLATRDGERFCAASGILELLDEGRRDESLSWLRNAHFQSRAMVDTARQGRLEPGWSHTDAELLQAQGRAGRGMTYAMTRVFGMLPGLEERLRSEDAAFLDVGIGVGIIAIELCRIYRTLHVVGLEPGDAQIAEARKNIAEARLEDRIEVRRQSLEDLDDRDAFDLAYVASTFMPLHVLRDGLPRVLAALRPGGWASIVAFDAPGDGLHASTSRLINALWGGSPMDDTAAVALMREVGFEMVQAGGAPGSTVKGVMGRRSVAGP